MKTIKERVEEFLEAFMKNEVSVLRIDLKFCPDCGKPKREEEKCT